MSEIFFARLLFGLAMHALIDIVVSFCQTGLFSTLTVYLDSRFIALRVTFNQV